VQLWWQQFMLIFLRTNVTFSTKTSLISYGGSNSSQGGALCGVLLLRQSLPLSHGSRQRPCSEQESTIVYNTRGVTLADDSALRGLRILAHRFKIRKNSQILPTF